MSRSKTKFYEIFWRNKACRNLFLLNKDELLEHQEVVIGDIRKQVYENLLVVTNDKERDVNYELLENRLQNRNLDTGNSLEFKLQQYQPQIEQFVEEHFGKSIGKLEHDFKNPLKWPSLVRKIFKLFNADKSEETLIGLLQEYYFIGEHITNYEQLEANTMSFIKKHFKFLVNEKTTFHFYDSIENIKSLYSNFLYKKMLDSKRVLTGYFHEHDSFEDRLSMLDLLFESGVLEHSNREVFFECTNCEPGICKGALTLRVRPKKLSRLKCPNCEKELFYLAPYRIEETIYQEITGQDGIVSDILISELIRRQLYPEKNIPVTGIVNGTQENSEIDAGVRLADLYTHVFEVKMFHLNNSKEKHKKKLLTSLKEVAVLKQILESNQQANALTRYYIITNVDNEELFAEVIHSFETYDFQGTLQIKHITAVPDMQFT